MKKYLFAAFALISIGLAITLMACNKDSITEGQIAEDFNDDNAFDIPSEDVLFAEQGDVQVEFKLFNEAGENTTTFAEGEDIIFDLIICNTGDEPIPIDYSPSYLGENTFRVYTSKGKDMGVPWAYYVDWDKRGHYLISGRELFSEGDQHIRCPWYGSNTADQLSFPGYLKEDNPHLSSGSYYTTAYVHVNEQMNFHCGIHFVIQPR